VCIPRVFLRLTTKGWSLYTRRKIQTEGPIYIDSPWLAAGPVYDDEAKADADSPVLTADAQPEDEVTVRFARWWYDDHYGMWEQYDSYCIP
jgi:hypothetical protein